MANQLANNIRDAITNNEYIVVSNIRIPQNGLLRFQTDHPDYISVPEYHITGTPVDISTTLTNLGLDINQVQTILNRYSNQYSEEKIVSPEALEKLRQYPFEFKPYLNTRVKPLIDKIKALPYGEVIDVSNINIDGTRTHAINIPPQGSKKISISGIPIVSDNFVGFYMAFSMLPGGKENYANELEALRNIFYPDTYLFPEYISSNLITRFGSQQGYRPFSMTTTQQIRVPQSPIIPVTQASSPRSIIQPSVIPITQVSSPRSAIQLPIVQLPRTPTVQVSTSTVPLPSSRMQIPPFQLPQIRQ